MTITDDMGGGREMLAVTVAEAVPLVLGAGGVTAIASFVAQIFTGHETHDLGEQQLVAQRWKDLMAGFVAANEACLERERELREAERELSAQLRELRDHLYTRGEGGSK